MTRLLREETAGDTETDGGEATEPVGGETPETDGGEATEPVGGETPETNGGEIPEADGGETPEAVGGETPEADGDDRPETTSVTDGDATGTTGTTGRRSAGAWRKGALAAALTVLLLGGSGFFHAAHQLRSTPSARNHALTDTENTTRVSGDVAEGLARVFSYTAANTDAAERSARTVLAGRAARQYADLLAQVRAHLLEQRITLSTQTVRTGVIELDGDSARLLVFLDQRSRRDKAAATSAAAQLTVTAEYRGDRWLIVDIKAR
ncbi:hypothetical protein ACF07V_04640 [Streptomyces sp. NPDC015661]|uniref:hypothetical protein n=1 Tax=Streptomyces sp. NPDC015661 TaxID=3364961 RepID=UPI0036FACFF4